MQSCFLMLDATYLGNQLHIRVHKLNVSTDDVNTENLEGNPARIHTAVLHRIFVSA
jgi:hypothetical protein